MVEQLQSIFQRYEGERSELIPILQDVEDSLGYISPEAMRETAKFLNMPAAAVYGVVTFYAQFHLTPQGRHKIKICQGTACHVRGSGAIVRAVREAIGIGPGETTSDHEFSLEGVACFGSCALAPVMVVNGKVFGKLTPQQAVKILEGLS